MFAFQKQVQALADLLIAESTRRNGKPLLSKDDAHDMAALRYAAYRTIGADLCVMFGGYRWSIPAPYRPGDVVLCVPAATVASLFISDSQKLNPNVSASMGGEDKPAPRRAAPFPYLSEVEATLLIPAARLGHFRLIPADGWSEDEIAREVLPGLAHWGNRYMALAMAAYAPASTSATEPPTKCPATCPHITTPLCPGWRSPRQCEERLAHAASSPVPRTQNVAPRSGRPAEPLSTAGNPGLRCCSMCCPMVQP